MAGVLEPRKLSAAAEALDSRARRAAPLLRTGDMDGRPAPCGPRYRVPHLAVRARVLLVGLGKDGELAAKGYRDAVRTRGARARRHRRAEAPCSLPELPLPGRDSAWKVRQAALVAPTRCTASIK